MLPKEISINRCDDCSQGIVDRVRGPYSGCDGVHLRLRLRERYSSFQTGVDPVSPPLETMFRPRIPSQRKPVLWIATVIGWQKACRHHPDHLIVGAVEHNLLPDNGGVGA